MRLNCGYGVTTVFVSVMCPYSGSFIRYSVYEVMYFCEKENTKPAGDSILD